MRNSHSIALFFHFSQLYSHLTIIDILMKKNNERFSHHRAADKIMFYTHNTVCNKILIVRILNKLKSQEVTKFTSQIIIMLSFSLNAVYRHLHNSTVEPQSLLVSLAKSKRLLCKE